MHLLVLICWFCLWRFSLPLPLFVGNCLFLVWVCSSYTSHVVLFCRFVFGRLGAGLSRLTIPVVLSLLGQGFVLRVGLGGSV